MLKKAFIISLFIATPTIFAMEQEQDQNLYKSLKGLQAIAKSSKEQKSAAKVKEKCSLGSLELLLLNPTPDKVQFIFGPFRFSYPWSKFVDCSESEPISSKAFSIFPASQTLISSSKAALLEKKKLTAPVENNLNAWEAMDKGT